MNPQQLIFPEMMILARTIYGEARGEPFLGQKAVGHVVFNRLAEKPQHTISEICLQPHQFSCWNEKDPNLEKINAVTLEDKSLFKCLKAAFDSLYEHESLEDPTKGATHYHTRQVHPYWAEGVTPLFEIGNHIFYRIAF